MDIRKVRRASARSDVRDHPEVAHKVVTEDAAGGGDKGDEGAANRGAGWSILTKLRQLLGGDAGAGGDSVGDMLSKPATRQPYRRARSRHGGW